MDDVITLVHQTTTGWDEYGNPIEAFTYRELMCKVYSVSRNEFYSAATANLHPELIVRLSDVADYEGEKVAIFHGKEYAILRTFRDDGSFHHRTGMSANEIELVLERRVGHGEQDGRGADGQDPCGVCR